MSLDPTFMFGALDLAAAPFAIAFGHDRGTPEAVVADVQSSLSDGSMTKVTRWDNRTVTLPVVIQAATMQALADAEALLVAEAMKPSNEFTFNPGDGTAADSVYDTYAADLAQDYDDDREIAFLRSYTLTFKAHPWPRSANLITTPAPSTTITTTTVDSGAATTNWTALLAATSPGPSISVVSGAVTSTYNPATNDAGFYGTRLRRAFPVALNVSVDKYISIDWKSSIPSVQALIPTGVGNLTEVRREPGAVAGFTRSWYQVPDSVASMTSFDFGIIHPASTGSATLSIDLVQKQNALPISGTARQKLMSLVPGGSVKTQGTIHVTHPTSSLGRALIFTYPTDSGYSPALRPWLASSDTVTADTSVTVSGAYHSLTGVTRFNIPITSIPRGDTQLWARVGTSSGTGPVGIYSTARSLVGGVVVGDPQFSVTTVNFTAVGDWLMVPIGRFALPTAQVGPAGFVYIDMQRDATATPTVMLDDAYLFSMDEGRLTVVDCGTAAPSAGGAANHLWITAPSVTDPAGRVSIGTKADQSDAYWPPSASVKSSQVHEFAPDGTNVFVVTANATDAATNLTHYRRWHTNAGS